MRKYFFTKLATIFILQIIPTMVCAGWLLESDVHWSLNKSLMEGPGGALTKESYKGKEMFSLGNFAITSQYPIKTENVSVEIDYEFLPIDKIGFEIPIQFASQKLKLQINIGNLIFSQEVTQTNGSNQIISQVQAECRDVKLIQNDPKTSIAGTFKISNKPGSISSILNGSKIFWPEDTWQIAHLKCDGVEGFEKVAKYEIEKYLKNPDNMQKLVEQKLGELIAKWVNELSSSIFSIKELPLTTPNLKSRFIPHLMEENKNYFNVVTTAQIDYTNTPNEPHVNVPLNKSELDISPSKGLTMFSQKFAIRALERLWQNGNLIQSSSTKGWTEFNDLLKNKTATDAVWPDLGNFKPNSEFKIILTVVQKPTITRENPNDTFFVLKTYVSIQILAPKAGQYYPYAEFFTYLRGDVSFQVEKGNLVVGLTNIQTRQGGPKGGLISEYKKKFKVKNDTIDADSIAGYLKDYIAKKKLTIPLPEWKISSQVSLKAKEIKQSKNLFYLLWN